MTWLKYEICHKSGYSSAEYVEIEGMGNADLEELKRDIKNGPDGDPDGIREPRWEVLEELPLHVLKQKVATAEAQELSSMHYSVRLRCMLRKRTEGK